MSWEDVTGANPNLTRFLDFLGKAEGADWNTIVGGRQFNAYDAHPNVVGLRTKEGPSTAAGRYQITKTTYDDVAPRLGITDFSPESQNRIAIELIRRKGALEDVLGGNYENAIKKLGATWASLPSSPYSQPKRDWNFVKANLLSQGGDDGWETITPRQQASNDTGWEDVAPAKPAAAAAPAVATKPSAAPAKKEEPRGVLRRVDDFVRGVADTVTFGYADEIAGKLDSLFGGGQSGLKTYEAAVAAQRQRDKEGGGERIAGQLTGALAPTIGVVRAVDGATRLARAGAGATTGAIQGGLYGTGSAEGGLEDRLKGGAIGAGTGLVLGGTVGAVLPATLTQKANAFVKEAGSDEGARIAAEVTKDFRRVATNPDIRATNDAGQATVATVLRNQQASRYVDDVVEAVKRVEPTLLKKFDVATLLKPDRVVTQSELAAMRSAGASGEVLADAVQKYQKAMALTAPTPASGSLGAKVLRFGIENTPRVAAAATGASAMGPAGLLLGAITPSASGFAQRLTGKATVPEVITKLSSDKKVEIADEVLRRLGPSRASQGAENIADLARKAESAAAAQKAAKEAEKAAKAAAGPAAPRAAKATDPKVAIAELQGKDPTYLLGLGNRFGPPRNADEMSEFSNVIKAQMEARLARQAAGAEKAKLASEVAKGPQVDPRIQVLQDTRRPLSGAFQELLPGGRSNLNLSSQEAIDALRLTSRQFKDRPVGQAAQDILRSGNVNDEAAFYGLQNQLRKLQEQGVLGGRPGALSEASVSAVRNPISYAEAVRTAGAAADLARANAPSKELAQFATRVAGIKSPEAKAKAVADRLSKTTDPAEQAFLTNFVEPLAQFGKK